MTTRNARLIQHSKINHFGHINRIKKTPTIMSIDGENESDKIQHP